MKKIVLVLLTFVMLLSLCACGSDDTQTTEPSATPSQTTTDSTQQTTDGTEGTSEATQAPTDEPTTAPTEEPIAPPTQAPIEAPTTPPTTQPAVCSHSWKDATCTAPKTCSKCGATEGSAAGHSWKDATCTAPKTCSKCGVTEGSAAGHSWKDATCTASKTCSKCNATEGNAAGHSWKDATCTAPKTCSKCSVTEGNAAGHNWNNATCTAPKTCKTCGVTEGDVADHVLVTTPAVAATCTTDGKTEGKHCSKCNEVIEIPEIIYATGCNYQNWVTIKAQTVDTEGLQERKCVECGKTETRTIPTTEPTAIFIENNTITIFENEVMTLRPILTPAGSKTRFTFSSSNNEVVTVAPAGNNNSCNITGVSKGNATVTIATEFGLVFTCEITVKEAPQPTAIIIPENICIKIGEVYHIPIELEPFDSTTLFTISTSDAAVVSVNTTGGGSGVCITGISSGEATIVIYSSNGLSASSHVVVEWGVEVSEIIIPEEYTIFQGDDWDVPIELNPTDAYTTFSITTTNPSICDVNTTGGSTGCRVFAYSVGEAIITIFTDNGKSASCKIIVVSRE